MPAGLARSACNGLTVFVDGAGRRRPFRVWLLPVWLLPVEGAQHIKAAVAAKRPPDLLVNDLQGPIGDR